MVPRADSGGAQRRTGFFSGIKAELAEAVRLYTRYDTPDKNGETRRERNERMGEYAPELSIPIEHSHIWEWYISLNDTIPRFSDGYYRSISPSDYFMWAKLTGNVVYSYEYDILMAMDKAFCDETNKEIEAVRARQDDDYKRKMEKGRR